MFCRVFYTLPLLYFLLNFRSAAPIAKPHLRAYCGCRRSLLMNRRSSHVYARPQNHASMVSVPGQYMAELESHIWLCIFGLINQMPLPRTSVLPAEYLSHFPQGSSELLVALVELQVELFELCKHFFQGFASEVTDFHHILRSLVCKLFYRIDSGSLQTIV